MLNRKRIFIGLLVMVLALTGAIFSRAITLISKIPKDENLSVALRIQAPSEWYRSARLSSYFLENETSSTWCDLNLLKNNSIDIVVIPEAKLIYLLQIFEAYSAGLFQEVDLVLLQKLIDIGISKCDLNSQLNPPEEFKKLLGAHRALVYASMSGNKELYRRLIEHGARTDFIVRSSAGGGVQFDEFHRNRNHK